MLAHGERHRASEIGYKGDNWYFWGICPTCSKGRWISAKCRLDMRCFHCACVRERTLRKDGYVEIYLPLNDFFRSMAVTGSAKVLEHRLVMAKYLGRNLHLWEIVHHKNHVKDDNRIENLQLVSDDKHNQLTLLESRITRLEWKLAEEIKQRRLLQWEIKELQKERELRK